MSNSHVNTTIYAMILIIGVLFIPLQFGFANTNTPTYNLQGVISHICDQTMSTSPYQSHMVGGCSIGGSYRAVQDTQNTVPDTNSNSSGSSSAASNFGTLDDRRHDTK